MLRKRWATLVGRTAQLHSPALPAHRLSRVLSSYRRRIDDAVEDVFRQACAAGDLETAEELIGILTNLHERRKAKFSGERRVSDNHIVRAKEDLLRRTLLRPADGSIKVATTA
jgi:hypothetical protein